MKAPAAQDWLFAAKTFAAAMLAWPRPVATVLAARLNAWLAAARDASLAAFEGTRTGTDESLSLAAEALAFETFGTHLVFERGES